MEGLAKYLNRVIIEARKGGIWLYIIDQHTHELNKRDYFKNS